MPVSQRLTSVPTSGMRSVPSTAASADRDGCWSPCPRGPARPSSSPNCSPTWPVVPCSYSHTGRNWSSRPPTTRQAPGDPALVAEQEAFAPWRGQGRGGQHPQPAYTPAVEVSRLDATVIHDECHHAAADDNKRVLAELGCFDRDWTGTLLGFTATPNRATGSGWTTSSRRSCTRAICTR